MRKLFTILTLTILIVLSGCGGDEGFVIKCDIKGLDTRGLEMVYMTRHGLSKASFHPVDGKVELRGASRQPTLVEVFTLDGELLFTCVASDGDRMKLKMTLDDPTSLTITGQDATRDYTAFITQHDSILTHGSDAEVNRMIAESVRSNPSSMASTLLMVTRFRSAGHELEADSLMSEILPEARPALLSSFYASAIGEQVATSARGEVRSFTLRIGRTATGRDTTVRYIPSQQSYSLLAFTDTRKPDSLTRRLRNLKKELKDRQFKIVEVSLSTDSASWFSATRSDSVNWSRAWSPGSAASRDIRRLAIPRTPYFILVDSQGTQVYRGTSAYIADTIVRSRLKQYFHSEKPDSALLTDSGPEAAK